MRRGLGRGRALIGAGAVLAMAGMPLDWWRVGGEFLPALTGNGFDGAGVLVFLASVGLLAVIALPYASRTGRSSLDRPAVFALLVAVGCVGLGIEMVTFWNESRLGGPSEAPGLWFAGAGLILAAWGTAEDFADRSSVS